MRRSYASLICLFLGILAALLSCKGSHPLLETEENLYAKKILQGVWIDEEMDMPFMEVGGDSIFYADSDIMPASFFIMNDTFYVVGIDTVAYAIDLQTETRFNFHHQSDMLVKLYKSEDESIYAEDYPVTLPLIDEVLEKDSVVMYGGKRYHGYVYINPSQMKVIRRAMSASGMLLENIYYDNIIHICVYTGTQLLYGEDITKQHFADYIPADFLAGSILADMNFIGVDARGYRYQAFVGEPDSSVGYMFNLTIPEGGQLQIELAD